MPQCGRDLAEVFADAGRVEMGNGVAGIDLCRALVGRKGFLGPSEILERDAEVEGGGRVVRARGESLPVMRLGLPRVSPLMQQPSEVDVGVRMPGVELEGVFVRLPRLRRRNRFQLASPAVPFLGRKLPWSGLRLAKG